MLEEFYEKYKQPIDETIARLQNDEESVPVNENEEEFVDVEEVS